MTNTSNLQNLTRTKKVATVQDRYTFDLDNKEEQIDGLAKDLKNIEIERQPLLTLAKAVKEGFLNALDVQRKIFELEDEIKEAKKIIQEDVLEEASNLKKEEIYKAGFELSYSSNILDYKQDPEVLRLETELKERKKLVKFATDKPNTPLFDEEGVQILPVKIKSFGKQYIKRRKKS